MTTAAFRKPCLAVAVLALAALSSQAQPTFGNPSPTAGSSTSEKANAAADSAAYREVEYTNRNKRGPALVVIPGEIKASNATFTQKFSSNNIADFGELELSNANFPVLERANLGNLIQEVSLAYNMGDPALARKSMQMGKLKTTKWIVKFDILKAEQIAENKKGFDGRAVGSLLSMLWRWHCRCGSRHRDRLRQQPGHHRCVVDWHALQNHGCQHHGPGSPRLQRTEDGSRCDAV